MMVDYLAARLPDPFGLPINNGQIAKLSRDGELLWSSYTREILEGSWSSSMQVRNLSHPDSFQDWRQENTLEVWGNPAKFLTGHNLFGSDDVNGLAVSLVERIGQICYPEIGLVAYDPGEAEISRIDITDSWVLDREGDVLPFLQALQERVFCPYRGRGVFASGDPSTLYYGYSSKGKRAKDWTLKLYWKGREIGVHPLPLPAYQVPGLLDEVNRTVRVELTLRTQELKRLGLRTIKCWTPEIVAQVWRDYVNRLDLGGLEMRLDYADVAGCDLPPRYQDAIASWKAGNDLRQGRSKTAFYAMRKRIREVTGYDVAAPCPKSNVVPLTRIIEAKPQGRPAWADQLTRVLQNAA